MSFKKSGELSVFQLIKNIKLKNTKLKNYKSEEKLDNKGPWIIINETPFFLHTVTSKQNTVLREKKKGFIMNAWKSLQNQNDFSRHRGITVSLSQQFTFNLVFNHLETMV